MNIHTIQHIDIDKYTTIEEERGKILSDKEFQKWCKEMRIGPRIEVKDYKANELMQQYSNYPKWVSRLY